MHTRYLKWTYGHNGQNYGPGLVEIPDDLAKHIDLSSPPVITDNTARLAEEAADVFEAAAEVRQRAERPTDSRESAKGERHPQATDAVLLQAIRQQEEEIQKLRDALSREELAHSDTKERLSLLQQEQTGGAQTPGVPVEPAGVVAPGGSGQQSTDEPPAQPTRAEINAQAQAARKASKTPETTPPAQAAQTTTPPDNEEEEESPEQERDSTPDTTPERPPVTPGQAETRATEEGGFTIDLPETPAETPPNRPRNARQQ